MRGSKLWVFLGVLPLLVGFDWGTKTVVNRTLAVGEEVRVIPGLLSWTHAENPDIAFSLPAPPALIVGAAVVLLIGLVWTLWKLPSGARLQAAALATMAAGGIGNLVDRLMDGTVTDFVQVYLDDATVAPWLVRHFHTSTWPIFNVADACLFVGVVMWLVHGWFERESDPPALGLDGA
ncbi:MAG: signal peptidase II [Myxococcota bacterium]